MAAVSPDFPPPLWALMPDNRPAEAQQCLAALSFLASHPDQDATWNKQCADLLARTDISSLPQAVKTMDALFTKCSTLFPRVKVTIGNQEREIPKARLCLLSEKFATQLSDRWNTNTLNLGETEAPIAKSFLDYLATGMLDITGDNVTALFILADKHQVPSLIQACSQFLEINLDADSFPDVLKHALVAKNTDLLWMCLICLSKDQTIAAQVPQGSEEAAFFNSVQACFQDNLTISRDNGIRTVTIQDADALTAEALQALKTLHTSCGIRGLVVKKATSLDPLNFIQTLDGMEIGNYSSDTRAPIPESWLQNAKIIVCRLCQALTIINAPNATDLNCSGCILLKTLKAPNATEVYCESCTSLTTLLIPNASEVWCSFCTSLKTLNAPKATTVFCQVCTSLITLNAPQATSVNCEYCTSHTTLDAPNAIYVNCNGCTSLTTFRAPVSITVQSYNCNSLPTLDAPSATKVDCSDCPSLTALSAPKAATVKCNRCFSLTILDAPSATQVSYLDCQSLTTIKIKRGREIIEKPENCTVEYV